MDVSIIIVNYNTCKMTQYCVDSIYSHTSGIDIEVIVVDNASKDGSREHFEAESRITYIYNDSNLGFGQANNIGVEHAKGEYVFFLNSDTYLLGNIIKEMVDFARTNPALSIGGLGTLLIDEDFNHSLSFGQFYSFASIWGSLLRKFHNRYDYQQVKYDEILKHEYTTVDYIIGADLLVPMSVINKTGVFDPIFFMYFEEEDLQRRMEEQGFKRYVLNKKGIVHLESKSFNSKTSYQRVKLFKTSNYLYTKRHFKNLQFYLMHLLYFSNRVKKVLNEYRKDFTLKEKIEFLFT